MTCTSARLPSMQTIEGQPFDYVLFVRAISDQHSWALDDGMIERYAQTLPALRNSASTSIPLALIAHNYHLDHAQVQALRDGHHPDHDRLWLEWMAQVLQILRRDGLDWSADIAVERDDLAQIARIGLAQALPNYCFQSRFSTWAYSVIQRSVKTYLRDLRAAKRTGTLVSIDQLGDPGIPNREQDSPEAHGDAAVLSMVINDILCSQPNPLLPQIFNLWVTSDLRMADIGLRVQLSESYVRSLVGQCRKLLKDSPVLREWLDGAEL